ncbi:hypothetical protein C3L33_03039, partial [Rhododendron williamsianum]
MEEDNGGGEFYLRYYVGHKGKFGHEFLEFEFRPDGNHRYANNSNYKNDTMIRKEVFSPPPPSASAAASSPTASLQVYLVVSCLRSGIMKEDDNNWPEPDRVGRQELEIVMGNEHISFTTSKIGSLIDVQSRFEVFRVLSYLTPLQDQTNIMAGGDIAERGFGLYDYAV